MLGKIEGGRRRDNRGWEGRMASPTQWTWVIASSGRWWRTGKPGMPQSMGSQRIRHEWATEQQKIWTDLTQEDTQIWWKAAAAAAESLQSCLTLCDPTDGSPPGSAIPRILQARTLEWAMKSYWTSYAIREMQVKTPTHLWEHLKSADTLAGCGQQEASLFAGGEAGPASAVHSSTISCKARHTLIFLGFYPNEWKT